MISVKHLVNPDSAGQKLAHGRRSGIWSEPKIRALKADFDRVYSKLLCCATIIIARSFARSQEENPCQAPPLHVHQLHLSE